MNTPVLQSGSNDANTVVPESVPAVTNLPIPTTPGALDFLTKPEVAERLRKSVRCVDGWMKSGRLSHIKIGRSVLFRWSDVQADLSRFRVNAR